MNTPNSQRRTSTQPTPALKESLEEWIAAYEGTLQGDILFPFLLVIVMEPLLRWMVVGSRGYKPTHQPHKSPNTVITYDDHGYAGNINITAGTIQDLKLQLTKLHLFGQYTELQMETTKCEAI